MFKIFVIIIIAVGIFFWYPTSGDPIKKEILSPTTPHSVQLPPAEHSKATVFLLSILPPKQTWPRRMYGSVLKSKKVLAADFVFSAIQD